MNIQEDYNLVLLNVMSLFTNVLIDVALESMKNGITYKKNVNFRKQIFWAVPFVLSSTYFTFDNVIYKQPFGTSMGSSLSSIIANLVLQSLENTALRLLNNQLSFFFIDMLTYVRQSLPFDITILEHFNSFHPWLQFTLENGGESLNFLDITMKKEEKELWLSYHKSSYSGKYLNFLSKHPISQKRDTIKSLVDKALSDAKNTENLKFVINTLLENDYSLDFIFNTVNKRIHSLMKQKVETPIHSNNEIESDRTSWFSFIYIFYSLTEKFKQFNNKDSKVGFYSTNKLQKFIKVQKDPWFQDQCNLHLNCLDCDATYVEQIGNTIKNENYWTS